MILLISLVGFAAEITAVIIGFIIVSGKIKSVKILGIGYIVTGIIGIVTQASFLARNIVRTSDIIRILINVDTAAAVVSSLFGLLCVCLFVHKNYGFVEDDYTPTGKWLMEAKAFKAFPLWFVHFLSERKIYNSSFSKYGTEYTLYKKNLQENSK